MKLVSPRFLLILTLFLLTTAITASADSVSDTDWTNVPSSQIHQQMSLAKSRALLSERFATQRIATAPMANTQTNYDVGFYDVRMRINDTTEIIYGTVRIVAAAAEDNVSQVQVDFYDNMTIDSITWPGGTRTYSRTTNVVTIDLDHAYNTGEQFEMTVHYHGHPIEGGFQAFAFDTRTSGKVMSSLSEPYYARTWWPCKDRMDDKADSFNIAIQVDSAFYVGSNGTLDSTILSTNTRTYYYCVRYPMASYLFSVACSKYTVWTNNYIYNGGLDTMPVVHATYPDRYSYALPRWGITPNAISLLSETFGPYPFLDEKYGHSNFEWGGGMEHQTMTSMTGSNFGFSEAVVVHELTHQWFGDMITCNNWGHIWLNEGFASYGEAVYYLNRDGWTNYHSYMQSQDYTLGGTIYVYDTSSVGNIFNNIVYDKGSWVVHMLRGVLGETKFAQAMDAYVTSQYQHKSATTEQFRDLVEVTTGEELDWFFQEWIYGTYRPAYQFAYYGENTPGGWNLYLHVAQTQTTNPQVFTMPVDIAIDYLDGTHDTVTVMVDERDEMFKLTLPKQVVNAEFDPNRWILRYLTDLTWGMYIVTTTPELDEGAQYHPYRDTIEQRGSQGALDITFLSGSLPPGLSIDAEGVITGLPTDTGSFTFTIRYRDTWGGTSDQATFTLHIGPGQLVPGDVNLSFTQCDLSDLSLIIAYLTIPGQTIPLGLTADVNNSCVVDLSDLSTMISFLTVGNVTMQVGCAP
ncbi:MAG: putative Ig domain-containing protein [bacterium]|nr:putative Ig domain-containing protein [bacterium]